MAKYKLILSKEADQDLDALYMEGCGKWGEAQADKYYDAILAHFDTLTETPLLYREVKEVREGYRRSICGKHSIFYRIDGDTVEIMGLVKYQNRFTTDSPR